MPAYGAYPIADAKTAGEEISSTYEGRHITLLESDLIHPTHTDGLVNKGDPVCSATGGGQIVGVALSSAVAAPDRIAIDTEGIWVLDVVAADGDGNSAVAGGDLIYINTTTGVLSKISSIATQVPFGYALGIITGGNTEAIAVKVHFDPLACCGDVVQAKEITFVEEGAGVYTGSVTIPAGATINNVVVHAVALWDAATSATLIVGDVADPNGFFDAVDLKATNLLAGESIDFAHTGGVEGADVDAPAAAVEVRRRYLAGPRVVTGEVTSVGAGTAGRTRITVTYSKPDTSTLATFV